MAAVRVVSGVGLVLSLIAATFVGVGIMAGLVTPEDVPWWPDPVPACATAPGFEVAAGGAAATVVRLGGDLDLAGADAVLAERGHDVRLVLAPVDDPVPTTLVGVDPTLPDDVGARTTGLGLPPGGATQLVLGPDTYAGAWEVRVGCTAA